MTFFFSWGGWATSAGKPFSFELKTLGEKVGYCQSLPSDFVLLRGSYIVFIYGGNPSTIFKMATSFEVTDVPFVFATPSTVAIGDTLCSDGAILVFTFVWPLTFAMTQCSQLLTLHE